jgi:hypothetical protein
MLHIKCNYSNLDMEFYNKILFNFNYNSLNYLFIEYKHIINMESFNNNIQNRDSSSN